MKKFMFYCAAALTLIMGMAACGNDEGVVVSVDSETIEFTAAGGTETVAVTGEGWTTSENSDWFRVEDFEDSFKVTADVNPVATAREGVITVTNNAGAKTVTVKQAAAGDGISVDALTLTFEGQAGTQTVTVTSEIAAWSATPAADSDWITVTPDTANMTFTVTVTANVEDEQRQGTITVGNGKEETTITVTQGTIEWYELKDYRGLYSEWSSNDALCNSVLSFYGAMLDSRHMAMAEFCYRVEVNIVIDKPDMTNKRLDIPAGTYEWGNTNSTTPFIYDDGYNNFAQPVRNGYATIGDIVDATWGRMVVTGEGNTRTVEIIYNLVDGTTFKARYIGSTYFNNPYIAGLIEDVDLGTMSVTGLAVCDESIVSFGYPASWVLHMCDDGVTLDETDTPQGTGWFIKVAASTETSDGQPGSPIKDGTYNVGNPAIFNKETGVSLGTSDGSDDKGSWLYRLEDGEVMDRAPIISGTVQISYSDPNYTLVLDVEDNGGYKIQGTLSGELTFKLNY